MIRRTVAKLFSFGLTEFFREIKVQGAESVKSGPVIVVGNHPNMFLDSLIVAHTAGRELFFLAKATLFKTPARSAILKTLGLIPVHRRQDNPEDMGKNEATFRTAIEVLYRNAGLALFPEGISKGERQILPLKTGAARIAFQAEEGRNFKLGLKIQPVGITYSDLARFRSSVTITRGEPIEVASLQAAYARDALAAVRELTETLEQALKNLTVEVPDAEERLLVERIARLYETRGSERSDFERFRLIAQNVSALSPTNPELHREIERRVGEYLDLVAAAGLDSDRPLEPRERKVMLLLRAPWVFLGVLISYLPYRFVGVLVGRMSREPVSQASLKFSFGTLIFPVWYLLLSGIVGWITGSVLLAVVSFLLCAFTGFMANRYWHEIRLLVLLAVWPGEKNPLAVLRTVRDDLIADLEKLRVA